MPRTADETQEAWDYGKFVQTYNDISATYNGWVWDGSISAEELSRQFHLLGSRSVADFARSKFRYTQLYDDTL